MDKVPVLDGNLKRFSLDKGEECAEMSVVFFAPMKQNMQDAWVVFH